VLFTLNYKYLIYTDKLTFEHWGFKALLGTWMEFEVIASNSNCTRLKKYILLQIIYKSKLNKNNLREKLMPRALKKFDQFVADSMDSFEQDECCCY
jgi:hypothetical protein